MERNYESVNPACDTTQSWCLSCKILKTMQQATVKFSDGKEYKYISKYPVQEGDIAIIGNGYRSLSPMETTGKIGVVTEVLPKVEIKRDYAAELDFVFSKSPDKKMVKSCAEYIQKGSYISTDTPIRPITCFIRKLLAAASIIANKELASDDAIEAAKECIKGKPELDVEKIETIEWGPTAPIGVDFGQVFFTTDYSDMEGLLPERRSRKKNDDEVVTEIDEMIDEDVFDETLNNPKLADCIVKYSFLGAISIMARGGFLNLLRSFIEEKPAFNDLNTLTDNSEAIHSFKEIQEYLTTI